MRQVGIFEAKTRLSEFCAEVAASDGRIVITRRGQPLAILSSAKGVAQESSVWTSRRLFEKKQGRLKDDFDLPTRKPDPRRAAI